MSSSERAGNVYGDVTRPDRQAKARPKRKATESSESPALRFVTSSSFDQITGSAVLLNALFIGMQVQYEWSGETPLWVNLLDYLFCLVFLSEVLFRIWVLGLQRFFLDPVERSWNWFDTAIVSISTVDAAISIAQQSQGSSSSSSGNIGMFRVIRIIRITRVLRIIRALKMFKSLRILMAAVASTLQIGTYAVALIIAAMWTFGIAITQVAADHWKEQKAKGVLLADSDDLMVFFGSLWKSVLTLFMTIAGGIDWRDAANPLLELDNKVGIVIFLFYVVIMILCVMNVLTGIFCQAAIETAALDKESVIEYQMQDRQRYVDSLKELFNSIDDSGDGKCSFEEFENSLGDEKMQALLRSMDIEVRDALSIFDMFDVDDTGEIDMAEFITGCITLRGNAKAVHLEKMKRLGKETNHRVEVLEKNMQSMMRVIEAEDMRTDRRRTS